MEIIFALAILACLGSHSTVAFPYSETQQQSPNITEEEHGLIGLGNGILRTYMRVEIQGIGCGSMCVNCWSGDHDKDRSGCTTGDMVFTWDFTAGPSTKFWCKAEWHQNAQNSQILAYLPQFAVFGGDVPGKSSTWSVDKKGKKRIKEDSDDKSDYIRDWTIY